MPLPPEPRILVLADTHLGPAGKPLPKLVLAAAEEADLILHAGDVTSRRVLDTLRACAPVVAVAGNNDGDDLMAALPKTAVVPVGGHRIGVVHGDGLKGATFDRAAVAFASDTVDVVVFGHSHQPLWQQANGRWYLNPGSPTQRRREPAYSFAWLRLTPAIDAEIVRFSDRS